MIHYIQASALKLEFAKSAILFTCVGVIIFVSVILCASLVGWIKFADKRQQNKLFTVLIIGICSAGVTFFADSLSTKKVATPQTPTDQSNISPPTELDSVKPLLLNAMEDSAQVITFASLPEDEVGNFAGGGLEGWKGHTSRYINKLDDRLKRLTEHSEFDLLPEPSKEIILEVKATLWRLSEHPLRYKQTLFEEGNMLLEGLARGLVFANHTRVRLDNLSRDHYLRKLIQIAQQQGVSDITMSRLNQLE